MGGEGKERTKSDMMQKSDDDAQKVLCRSNSISSCQA